MSLNAYMVAVGDFGEGAALVFARTAKEARRVGGDTVIGWGCEGQWIDVRAIRIRDNLTHIFGMGDADKLAAQTPHVIECPDSCDSCERWGGVPVAAGGCTNCAEEMAA